MRLALATFAAPVAAALLVAGCGGTDEAATPTATTDVAMAKSYRFEPKRIAVDAGKTVTWTNDDNFTHTVQVDGQEDHKVEPGDKVSIAFDKAGTYHYVCTLHSKDMEGEVIVQ
jgi:plastocyanin